MRHYKIVVLGGEGVGKTALIARLVKGEYLGNYEPTIEDKFRKQLEIDRMPLDLEILDTSGKEQFAAMRDLYMKNGDGFIIVYSVTNNRSIIDAAELFQHLVRVRQRYHFPLILVGNKCDDVANRHVWPSHGEQIAAKFNSTFCETSARSNTHVFDIFEDIVRQIKIEEDIAQSRSQSKRWYPDEERSMCCFM